MVGANDFVVLDPAQGDRSPPMNAEIGKCTNNIAQTADDNVLSQEFDRNWLIGNFVRVSYGVPVICKRWPNCTLA
jgi:hypothetical protein